MSNDNKGTDNMTAIIIYFHDNLKFTNDQFTTFAPKTVTPYDQWKD